VTPSARSLSLTEQLRSFCDGDREAANAVLRAIWPKLREIAARHLSKERYFSPVSPTELVNETWLQQIHKGGWSIRDREHFYGIAGYAMRRVLVDYARKRLALKRGGLASPVSLSACLTDPPDTRKAAQLVEIGLLMEKLGREDRQCMRVVDLHYFVGFTFKEVARIMGLRPRQVRQLWEKARNWLKEQLSSR
jgi:RNA polymerase sigma factor (TIGR02999 family)